MTEMTAKLLLAFDNETVKISCFYSFEHSNITVLPKTGFPLRLNSCVTIQYKKTDTVSSHTNFPRNLGLNAVIFVMRSDNFLEHDQEITSVNSSG